jgi:hypothetical protein
MDISAELAQIYQLLEDQEAKLIELHRHLRALLTIWKAIPIFSIPTRVFTEAWEAAWYFGNDASGGFLSASRGFRTQGYLAGAGGGL